VTDPVTLTAALTGPLASKEDNPHLPVTPEEIIAAAQAAAEAGAAIVHVHLRDDAGRPTADVEIAKRVVAGISERCEALVQLSTGVGLDVDFEEREQIVEARPTMATLNVCSMSFAGGEFRNPPAGVRRLAARMLELGIKPEIEIYDSGHLDAAMQLRDEGLLADPLQFSIVLGVRGGMAASIDNLNLLLSKLPEGAVWQVIAIGRSNLKMTTIGLALGGNARTGMEDTLTIRRGRPVRSNAELIERLVGVARTLERPVDAPHEAARSLALAAPG
jgi:uncharacterized protein (DUF849 family)